jgi:hypothetical protein
MGFLKGTDGIARTIRNPLEGSIGDVALDDIKTNTLTSTGNITGGNLSAVNLVINNISSDDSSYVNVEDGLAVTGEILASGNVTGGNLITGGNITGNVSGFSLGYRDIPQVAFTGNATIATADAGKHFYSTQSTNYTLTIANNASQAFQTGSAVTIINQGTGNITVTQGSGVTLYLAGNATAGNRTVSTFGMATLIKVATDTWFINGTGVA